MTRAASFFSAIRWISAPVERRPAIRHFSSVILLRIAVSKVGKVALAVDEHGTVQRES